MTLAHVDKERLWSSLMDMARIGATPAGGCNRQTLTDDDRQARDLLVQWVRHEGCSVAIDEVGNIFARRAGAEPHAPPVLLGSHLDTQPTGGRFDGVYGVMAALEVVRTLNAHGIPTRRPIEIVDWTNEEGCRFPPAMLGSGVMAGSYDRDYAYARLDRSGARFGDELARIGYRGSLAARRRPYHAAFEAHIEQGPVLERSATTIGVVTGIQGAYWLDVTLEGMAAHAGTTPMELRHDPWRAACPIIEQAFVLAAAHAPDARATIGDCKIFPGSRNTVPNRLVISVDVRHPDADLLGQMVEKFRTAVAKLAQSAGVDSKVDQIWHMPPTRFDARLIGLVDEAAQGLGYSRRRIVSGAGHDSLHTAQFVPSAMIFVPCAQGLSHNEAESASPTDLAAGANVLLQVAVAAANE